MNDKQIWFETNEQMNLQSLPRSSLFFFSKDAVNNVDSTCLAMFFLSFKSRGFKDIKYDIIACQLLPPVPFTWSLKSGQFDETYHRPLVLVYLILLQTTNNFSFCCQIYGNKSPDLRKNQFLSPSSQPPPPST